MGQRKEGEHREHEQDASDPRVLDAVARSLTLLGDSGLIHRFRATRPLAAEYESNILTFLMLVSNRGQEADQLFSVMALLTDCNATQLVRNPHNVCYLNASLTGLLWAGEIAAKADDCFGAHASAFKALTTGTARKPVYVPGLFNWAGLLRGWSNLSQQHDCAEFSDCLLSRLQPSAFQGAWEARLNDGSSIECRDRGNVPPSLPVAIPESTVSLQALVEAWHCQEATFAFTRAPRFLLLQLKRYRHEDAEASKLKTPVTLSPHARILVPRFTSDSLCTEQVPYKLCFTVVHEGDSVHSGHYQCALATAGEPATLLLSNDGIAAEPVKASLMPWVEANCYLVCLRAI